MLRKTLLACGILASVLYAGTDVLAALRYPEYHSFTTRAVSELMARGAPTERLVDPLLLLYGALMMAFGVGVWTGARRARVKVTGGLLFAYAALGMLGPTLFEMDARGTHSPVGDVPHIVLTGIMVLFILASVAAGASLFGRGFRLYSYATLLIMVAFGVLTSLQAGDIAASTPAGWVGLTERINIGAFLAWVVVLAVSLLRGEERSGASGKRPGFIRRISAIVPG